MNRYFKDELAHLRDLRDGFSKEYEGLAEFLDYQRKDPDVESLFEGFAFLTGRLREKLEDDFPEFIQSVFQLLWPHYLRPVPAISLLAFEPIRYSYDRTKLIPKETEVQSRHSESGRAVFQTTQEVILHPVVMRSVEGTDLGNRFQLNMTLDVWPNAKIEGNDSDPIRLYFHGSGEFSQLWYYHFLRNIKEMEVSYIRDGKVLEKVGLDRNYLKAGGFSVEDLLFSLSDNTPPPGYLYLQEYFTFPEKYYCVDIYRFVELARRAVSLRADSMVFEFNFGKSPYHKEMAITDKSRMYLYCSPIINVFKGEARPISLDSTRAEYPIYTEKMQGMGTSLYEVEAVTGQEEATGEAFDFHRFESFQSNVDMRKNAGRSVYYRVRGYSGDHGRYPKRNGSPGEQHMDRQKTPALSHSYISFINRTGAMMSPRAQIVSISVRCSNGVHTNDLNPGDICIPSTNSPEFATFKNLMKPSQYLDAPLEKDLLWKLISNMSLNYKSLMDEDSLKSILETYDFAGRYDYAAGRQTDRVLKELRIESSRGVDRIIKGYPVRGIETELSLSRSSFRNSGHLYLFASILDHFLSLFVSINSFHQLTVVEREQGEVFRWPPKAGMKSML